MKKSRRPAVECILLALLPLALSAAPGLPIVIDSTTPGSRIALFEGVTPLAVARSGPDGRARFPELKLAPGRHTLRAVEWGTGRVVADPLPVTIPLTPSRDLPVADHSTPGIVFADFDGDGRGDVAVADERGGIAILLDRGDGVLSPARFIGGAVHASALAAADFNGDGIPDLAAADPSSNAIFILQGNGDGTFAAPVSFTAADVGGGPVELTAEDFNQDGAADLAIRNQFDSSVVVLLNDGHGAFTSSRATSPTIRPRAASGPIPAYGFQTQVAYGVGGTPRFVAVGDFNNDGRPDLAVASHDDSLPNGKVSILPGNGNGTFGAPHDIFFGSGGETDPWAIAIGDFNGDHVLDLAVADSRNNQVAVLRGNGDGSFAAAVRYSVDSSPHSIVTGDFNGDGKLDLATANAGGSNVTVLLGKGDGTFLPAHNFTAGLMADSLVTADFNRDAKADLAVATFDGVNILAGAGDGSFTAGNVQAVEDSGGDHLAVAVGDFNGDGKADLAVAVINSNTISIRLGNGDGSFQPAIRYATGNYPDAIAVADLDGDGKADLAVANQNANTVSVLHGNGDGTFQPAIPYSVGYAPTSIAAGDFNGDGRYDLAVANHDSQSVGILLGLASPPQVTFQTDPAGLLIAIDGGVAQPAPFTVPLSQSQHSISVDTVQTGTPTVPGVQYTFLNWSDGGGSGHVIVPAGSSSTLTASFQKQYLLTVVASPAGGGTAIGAGYHAVNSTATAVATAADGYAFVGWSGPVQGNPLSPLALAVMTGPLTITANFAPLHDVTFQTVPSGRSIKVDQNAARATPFTIGLAEGGHTISALNGSIDAGTGAVFASWSDGGASSHQVAISAAATYTATYTIQYKLTTSASPSAGGNVTPTNHPFYDAGTVVSVQATPDAGYGFVSWTGPVANSSQASTTVTMSAPESITANFAPLSAVTFQTTPAGLQVAIDAGAPIATPVTLNLTQGTHTIAVPTPQSGVTGVRYAFSAWSDTGAAAHQITVGASPAAYTAAFVTRYLLTTSAFPSSSGSVSITPPSPAGDSYYDSGTTITVTAVPKPLNPFSSFSGALTGAANPGTLTITAPASIAANFIPPNPAMVVSLNGKSVQGSAVSLGMSLYNSGSGDAQNVTLTSVTASVLTGSGTVTVTAPALPLPFGVIAAGSWAALDVGLDGGLQFTITGNVTRIRVSWAGTMQNAIGTNLVFSGAAQLPLP